MNNKEKEKIIELCAKNTSVKLCYFFGSRSNGTSGPVSDYDFAIYLDEKDKNKRFDIKLKFIGKITYFLNTDRVDVLVLNDLKNPTLKFNIINSGVIMYEVEPFRLLVEPRVLNEYFDFNKQTNKIYEQIRDNKK